MIEGEPPGSQEGNLDQLTSDELLVLKMRIFSLVPRPGNTTNTVVSPLLNSEPVIDTVTGQVIGWTEPEDLR